MRRCPLKRRCWMLEMRLFVENHLFWMIFMVFSFKKQVSRGF